MPEEPKRRTVQDLLADARASPVESGESIKTRMDETQDSLNPSRYMQDYQPASISDKIRAIQESIRPEADRESERMIEQMMQVTQSLEQKLKDDEELQLMYHSSNENIRVTSLSCPRVNVAILRGTDQNGAETHIIANLQTVHLICKVVKVQTGKKPRRIGFEI